MPQEIAAFNFIICITILREIIIVYSKADFLYIFVMYTKIQLHQDKIPACNNDLCIVNTVRNTRCIVVLFYHSSKRNFSRTEKLSVNVNVKLIVVCLGNGVIFLGVAVSGAVNEPPAVFNKMSEVGGSPYTAIRFVLTIPLGPSVQQ